MHDRMRPRQRREGNGILIYSIILSGAILYQHAPQSSIRAVCVQELRVDRQMISSPSSCRRRQMVTMMADLKTLLKMLYADSACVACQCAVHRCDKWTKRTEP